MIAGNDDLEDKTFHYLNGSLFDILDDTPTSTTDDQAVVVSYLSEENNYNPAQSTIPAIDQNPKPRDTFGNIDESYGSTRFGAIFMDYFYSAKNLDKCNNKKILLIYFTLNYNLPY